MTPQEAEIASLRDRVTKSEQAMTEADRARIEAEKDTERAARVIEWQNDRLAKLEAEVARLRAILKRVADHFDNPFVDVLAALRKTEQ